MEQLKSTISNGQIDLLACHGLGWSTSLIHKLYVRLIRPHFSQKIHQQRLKLVWNVWGYSSILFISNVSLIDRLRLVVRFILIDWNVLHSHIPSEISSICQYLSEHPAHNSEVMIEAGCWNGGSSAKFSIICKILGYKLHIYDSFEGVEELTQEEKKKGHDFFRGIFSTGDHLEKQLDAVR